MKISDNGFSERIATPAPRTQQTTECGRSSSASNAYSRTGGSSDNLQLSNLASLLQASSSSDTNRSSRLAAIAKAVNSNSFQVDAMQISKAMVAEAVTGNAA